jgi:hypothetical protein
VSIKFRRKSNADQVLAGIKTRVQLVIDKVTFDIEADYKAGVGVDSGALQNSISAEKLAPFKNKVFSPLNYAYWHEIGTKYYKGNPALRRAVENHRRVFLEALKQALKG